MGLEREDNYSVGNPEEAGPDYPSILSWLRVSKALQDRGQARHLASRSPQSDRETDMWTRHPIRTRTMAFHKCSPCRAGPEKFYVV